MTDANRKQSAHRVNGLSWNRHLPSFLALVAVLCGSIAFARPPAVPLIQPCYSFDGSSPTVQDGTVGSADLLRPAGDTPVVKLPAANLGLGPADVLDALSSPNSGVASTDTFTILFSIDRTSLGGGPPDIQLAAQGVPYNAADQAAKGQAAGDQFMSLNLFDRAGGARQGRNAAAVDNNTLVVNNYDEGGVDFSAKPPTSAGDNVAARGAVPQDNVNATFGTTVPTSARNVGPDVGPTYFTLAAQPGAPAAPSGASIFFVADPTNAPPQIERFASPEDLGLLQTDDINAVIVFDDDDNGLFDGSDLIMFTLTRDSTSLANLGDPGAAASAADVFAVDAAGGLHQIATAASLGLDAATDSIDALDYILCDDAVACARLHGIRKPPAQIPAVSAWGLSLMVLMVLIAATVVLRRRRATIQ